MTHHRYDKRMMLRNTRGVPTILVSSSVQDHALRSENIFARKCHIRTYVSLCIVGKRLKSRGLRVPGETSLFCSVRSMSKAKDRERERERAGSWQEVRRQPIHERYVLVLMFAVLAPTCSGIILKNPMGGINEREYE